MTQVVPFKFDDKDVRVVTDGDGEPWFVAADVCKAISLASHKGSYKHHLDKLDEDERKVVPRTLIDGDPMLNMGVVAQEFVKYAGKAVWADPQVWLISESAVYTLILRSREATTPGTIQHQFKRWVTHEVLPSIRRTGSYASKQPERNTLPAGSADWIAQSALNAQTLVDTVIGLLGQEETNRLLPGGISVPDVAMGLAGMIMQRQRFLLEFEDLQNPTMRRLHTKEVVLDMRAADWADKMMSRLTREQVAQLMHAAARRMA